MPRDYAKKPRTNGNRRQSSSKPRLPAWLWLFVGAVLGAFVTFLVYLWELAPPPASLKERSPKPQVSLPEEPKTPKPRFDFYKLLQESEVIVPATEAPRINETRPSLESPAETMEYVLQVGSFANPADADRLRAQLIILSLDARVEQVSIRDGEIWHRVMVGPFTDQARLNNARSILVANQYNALMLKRKPE